MENWTEVRTAYHLARLGTVSAAAEALGVHRVTVIRHVDLLEASFGEKLFLRQPKGYTPTDAGWELMRVAQSTEEQFEQLSARLQASAQARAGELIVTSLPVVANLLMPAFAAFQRDHPGVVLRHVASARTLKLEKGEAHVAVRAAPGPEDPDNVTIPFTALRIGLYASPGYVEINGLPTSPDAVEKHRFIAPDAADMANSSKNYLEWLAEVAPNARIVFRTTNLASVDLAVASGLGIGIVPAFVAEPLGLVPVPIEAATNEARLDLVTHVDLHELPKIQALLSALVENAPRLSDPPS